MYSLGTPWGLLGDSLETPWGLLGGSQDFIGTPWGLLSNVWLSVTTSVDPWRNYYSHHARISWGATFTFSKEMHFVWAMIWVHNPGLEFVLFVFHVAFG